MPMALPLKKLFVVLLPIAFAACTTQETARQQAETTDQKSISRETLEAVAGEQVQPGELQPESKPEEKKDPAPKTVVLTPANLMGLEPAQVQEILGPVSLKRWEGDVQVMQFKGEKCVMDVYLYENAPGEAYEVSYLSARNPEGEDMADDICLTSLLPSRFLVEDSPR